MNRTTFGLAGLAIAAAIGGGLYLINSNQSQAGQDGFRLTDSEVAESNARISQGQQELIADGVVTWSDYETAFGRYVACQVAAGGTLEEPAHANKWRRLEATVALPAGNDPGAADGVIRSCYSENLSLIDQLWSMYNAPSESDLKDARKMFAGCLRAAGYTDVPEQPAREELVRWWPSQGGNIPPAIFYGCQAGVDQAFGLQGFGG